MVNASASAYYGQGKKLRDDTWQGVSADIERRLASGDLSEDLHFLSFAGRVMTSRGWVVLATALRRLRSCFTLDLQRCGIKDVSKLSSMLPEVVHKTKAFNLEGNTLSAKSVRRLVDAMAAAYAHVRPTWLSIGFDAQAPTTRCIVELACHPHHPRGCLCSQPSVVHIVRSLPKFDPIERARWEYEYLRPLEQYTMKRTCDLPKFSMVPPNTSLVCWPLLPAPSAKSPTPPTKTPSGGDSPKELPKEDAWSDCAPHVDALGVESAACTPRTKATESRSPKPCKTVPSDSLAAYVSQEKRAHEIEILCRLAGLCDICAAPLETAARFARKQASAALRDLQAGGNLSCWFLGERLLLLAASAEGWLLLADLTESASRGDVVDAHWAPACGAHPLHDFNFQATALPFAACPDKHELATEGGEILEISTEHTTRLASGWVAARWVGASTAYLWFPLGHCRMVD